MREITIRKANISDTRYFSKLVILSAPYFPLLFGRKIKIVLEYLFSSSGNLFSHEHVYFGVINTKRAGMILSYSWQTKKKENLRTGLLLFILLFRYIGIDILNKLPVMMKFNATVGKLNEEEYYISNIAVFHEFRRRGIGKKLMLIAENNARISNAKRVVLDVERDNISAITLYKQLGYQIVEEFSIPLNRYETLYFYRMIKGIR